MTEAEMHDHEMRHNSSDYLISLLGALTFGGVGWAVGYGLVEAARFGLAYFELALPESGTLADMIYTGFIAFPILLGLFVAWRSYAKLISLE